jgi:hypothetical protein
MRALHARSPGAHSATVCPAYPRRPPRRPQQRPYRRCTGRSCAGWTTKAAATTPTGHRAQLRRADRRSGRRWRSAQAGRTAEHGTQRSLPVRPALHRRLGPHHCRRRGHQPGDRGQCIPCGRRPAFLCTATASRTRLPPMLRRGWCDRQGADHRRDELGQCVAGEAPHRVHLVHEHACLCAGIAVHDLAGLTEGFGQHAARISTIDWP